MITIQKPAFAYNALEPFIDAQTMEIHVEKHHQTYADKLNAVLEKIEDRSLKLEEKSLSNLLTSDFQLPTSEVSQLRNFAGGVANHNFFWSILSPDFDQPAPSWFTPELKAKFTDAATKLFGSGWVWLVLSEVEGLKVISTPNQDSPLSQGLTPLVGIDLWEHAYYLKYQNRRPEYIESFWHIVNWNKVNSLIAHSPS